MKTKLFLWTVLCIFLNKTVHSQITEEALMNNIQGILDTKKGLYGMEGVAVAVAFPSHNIYTASSGYSASISTPVDVNKKWHWASSTKPLTGYVILDMHEKGILNINDPISNYIDTDTIVNVSGNIKIKDLLQHTSPLKEVWSSNQTNLWNTVWSNRPKVWCPWEVLNYMPSPDTGNTNHNYNSSNSYMLGFIIEAITGKNLETVFEEKIFTPLSMTNSYLSTCKTIDMNELNGVWNGSENRSSWSHTSYLSSRGGNSALIATIADVAKFYNTYYQGDLLSSDVMDMLRTPVQNSKKYLGAVGCATSIYQYHGFETEIYEVTTAEETFYMYGHGGNGVNNSLSFYFQKEDITIVIVNNDYTTLNTIGALFADIVCEINNNLPVQSLSVQETPKFINEIYPNPAKETITVKLNNLSNNNGLFILRDLNGRKILSTKIKAQNNAISLIDIASGMYSYQVIVDGISEFGKIVKE